MRATVAKRLRAKVYRDGSRRNPGKYVRLPGQSNILCHGLRRIYMAMKVAYLREKACPLVKAS